MITCRYCGRDNEGSAAHCRECGTLLGPTPPPVITASPLRPLISKPLISRSAVIVLKRLALAFGLVMVIHTLLAVGLRLLFDAIPTRVADFLFLGCVWLAPAVIYLVALYGAPALSACQTGALRIARVGILTGVAFGLSYASIGAFLAFWFLASIIFGFPVREG
jgi:hypothetical protein